MSGPEPTRYQMVSRRKMLKSSLGTGVLLLFPGLACGNDDASVFAGATAEPQPPDPTTSTTAPTITTTPTVPSSAPPSDVAAINGELVVSFTYTQGVTGKNERPYVAVWIEDVEGELLETVALWYQQGRRGERWLDHLTRWYDVDLARQAAGGVDEAATISSATRAPGSYAVAWDGLADGVPIPAGEYFVCIEAAREEGPYSLIREPFALAGSLAETALPDDGELSAASVRIDG